MKSIIFFLHRHFTGLVRPDFFSLLFLSSCSHLPEKAPIAFTPTQFWNEQALRSSQVSRIFGKVKMHYRGKKESISGRGRVVAELPTRIRMELRDPLGRMRYLVTLAGGSLVAYYPTLKIAYLDARSGAAYLKRIVGTSLSFDELQSLMLGLLPKSLHQKSFKEWKWDGGKGLYRGTLEFEERLLTLGIDPKLIAIREAQVDSRKESLQLNYADFQPCCEAIGKLSSKERVALAQSVNVSHLTSHSYIDVEWDEMRHFESPKNGEVYRVDLPEGVKTIPLN